MYLHIKRHVDGVGSVAFKDVDAADQCVLKMNGRWYGGKQLEVFTWDGTTDYQVRYLMGLQFQHFSL